MTRSARGPGRLGRLGGPGGPVAPVAPAIPLVVPRPRVCPLVSAMSAASSSRSRSRPGGATTARHPAVPLRPDGSGLRNHARRARGSDGSAPGWSAGWKFEGQEPASSPPQGRHLTVGDGHRAPQRQTGGPRPPGSWRLRAKRPLSRHKSGATLKAAMRRCHRGGMVPAAVCGAMRCRRCGAVRTARWGPRPQPHRASHPSVCPASPSPPDAHGAGSSRGCGGGPSRPPGGEAGPAFGELGGHVGVVGVGLAGRTRRGRRTRRPARAASARWPHARRRWPRRARPVDGRVQPAAPTSTAKADTPIRRRTATAAAREP